MGALLCYAVKANGHPDVVATLARCVDGLEVASAGELDLAGRAQPGMVVFGGPAKTDAALRAAVASGAIVHVESVHEVRRLAAVTRSAGLGNVAGTSVPVALRVNRAGTTPGASHRMAGTATQFGLDEADLPEDFRPAATPAGTRLIGFGLHAVSNSLDAGAYAAYAVDAVRWSVAAAARLGIALSYVNVGGGIGVDYTGGAQFDLARLSAGLAPAMAALPSGAQLAFEPGRALAASAGWYAAEVIEVKRTLGRWFAVIRGGTHHFRLPAAWGYSHPFTVLPVDRWPYPFDRPSVGGEPVTVAGELCTPRDVLARDVPVDRLRAGDIVVFGNAGAYGWDISAAAARLRRQRPRRGSARMARSASRRTCPVSRSR